MDKRGFLLGEETVKLILAVIAILFLVLFVVYLYNNFSQNKELEQAKSSLTHLTSEISAGSTEVQIYNPKDWVLSSWLSSTAPIIPGAANMPKQCLINKWDACLCLCAAPSGSVKTFLVACDTKGICMQNEFSVENNVIDIGKNPPLILSINQGEKIIKKNGT
jgi:Ca2+/Na+ antiporter